MVLKLKRFWIEFVYSAEHPLPMGMQRGCGVSAFHDEDAMHLLKTIVFSSASLPEIKKITENIVFSTLDKGHVLPNMGDVTVRGVWFPLGFFVR